VGIVQKGIAEAEHERRLAAEDAGELAREDREVAAADEENEKAASPG